MVKQKKDTNPDAQAKAPDAVDANLCEAALRLVDEPTRRLWLHLGAMRTFDTRLALKVAGRVASVSCAASVVRRWCELPVVEPAGTDCWTVRRGARRHCAGALLELLGETDYRRFHGDTARALRESMAADGDDWRLTLEQVRLGYHLLPDDEGAALELLFQTERRAAAAGCHGVVEAIVEACEDHRRLLSPGRPETGYFAGVRALRGGQAPKARQCLEAALATCGAREDSFVATLLGFLGQALARCEDIAGAVAALERSAALHERFGDLAGAGAVLLALGRVLCEGGRQEDGLTVLRQARRMARARQDEGAEASALQALGAASLHAGRREDADSALRQARKLFRLRRDARGEMYALLLLGQAHEAAGRYEDAVSSLLGALDLAEESAGERVVSGALQALAQVYRDQARQELFLVVSEKQVGVEQARRNRYGEFFAQCHIGDACYLLGDVAGALAAYKRALELSERQGTVTRHCRERVRLLQEQREGQSRPRAGARLAELDGIAASAPLAANSRPRPPAGDADLRRIAGARLIAVGAAPLRDLLAGGGPGYLYARAACDVAQRRKARLILSATCVGELVEALRRLGQTKAAARLVQVLSSAPNVSVIPIDGDLAARAARVRTTHPQLPLDQVYALMAAQLARADLFLTDSPETAAISRVPVVLCGSTEKS